MPVQKENPKITMSGRVDPRTVAVLGVYLEERGIKFANKSQLTDAVFEMLAQLIEVVEPGATERMLNNHVAIERLELMGIEFTSKRGRKDMIRALQHDSLNDLSDDELEKATAYIQQLRDGELDPKGLGKDKRKDLLDELEDL